MKKIAFDIEKKKIRSKMPVKVVRLNKDNLIDGYLYFCNSKKLDESDFLHIFDGQNYSFLYLKNLGYLAYEDFYFFLIQHSDFEKAIRLSLEEFSVSKYPYNVVFYKEGYLYTL